MPTLEVGKFFIPESGEVIAQDLLDDYYLEARKYGVTAPSVAPGTDNWFFFRAIGNASMLQYANIAQISPAFTPLFATGQDLENWRIALGLPVAEPSPSSGKITISVTPGAVVSIDDGQQFLLPNGLRGKVVGLHQGVVDGSDVSVIAIDTGKATNATAGTKVRLVNPPFNVKIEARVSRNQPLTGGSDTESEARKRARILNRLGTSAGGGNWGQHRETAFNALSSVQDVFVYPALGGPASEKVVVVREFDAERSDFHRQMSDGGVAVVRTAIQRTNSGSIAIPVDTVDELETEVGLYIDIPDSSLSGGNGLGWVDQEPWPTPAQENGTGLDDWNGVIVKVLAVTSPSSIAIGMVGPATTVIAGLTHISWWAPSVQRFYTALVLTASGTPDSTFGIVWTLTLDTPFIDANGTSVAVDDYISPAAVNSADYGKTFLRLMNALGPGENVTPGSGDIPRRLRHPDTSEGAQPSINRKFVGEIIRAHPEMDDAVAAFTPIATPTVPGALADRPRILIPKHFGIYPIQ